MGMVMQMRLLLLVVVLFIGVVLEFNGVVCSSYTRPPVRKTIFVPHDDDDSNSPEQVHISQVGQDKMRISWITSSPSPAKVEYGPSPSANALSSTGTTSSYRYLLYESGEIHDVVIGPLQPNTVYYYRLGDPPSSKVYQLKTPPSQLPIKFAIAGDLGQTDWTKSTLEHVAKSNYDMLLLPGDLAYADTIQNLWDSYGRLVEPLASQRPWMVTQGNHEVEKIPVVHSSKFTAFNARWRMPFEESASDSNLYYSFDVAGGVHVIMLGSYTDFEAGSSQYQWLQGDLKKVDREKTPWVVVLIHAPWYNSNEAHQGEKESDDMKAAMEDLLYQARVDVVFAGHVHAYERFTRVYKDKADNCGPVHITIGDGGNREGLATNYIDPKPDISLFREASFGHGTLDMFNSSHALWSWHKNDNDEAVLSDSAWLTTLSSNPACKS
ncbi:putative purple acid phosphatase 20 [Stylosanthes scabra]|uniref:Purple acid phosphatase n=1 Tax=Stylosanthes scabra TaxID=79078 RepID=A0ABU6VH16_9FABA|nr:putative purple acid phosphatase 20 [Stylosanthes scabra]